MDTMSAFLMGQLNRSKPLKVFDWHATARRIKEAQVQEASAGLQSDWEWTGGPIFKDGKPLKRSETYTYLASTWAMPELRLGDNPEEDCFVMMDDSPNWDSGTYWPLSALLILLDGDEEAAKKEYARIHEREAD